MKSRIVIVPELKSLIKKAPGFAKKELATYKLDIMALCGFGCRYCSSNTGNYLRINSKKFTTYAKAQLGVSKTHIEDPSLEYVYPDVVKQLEAELMQKNKSFGDGHTLIFSMLTDGFSPSLVKDGTTKAVLKLILKKTSFRIRVLTKNAVVGENEWIQFFAQYPDRFVVGLSTGSLDDTWSQCMELGTSSPSKRFAALKKLQDAGIPTFGMLCPVFPDVAMNGLLEQLISQVNPDKVEHIWVEPYNDRNNWKLVRNSFPGYSLTYAWFTDVYEYKNSRNWSSYATGMYVELREFATVHNWLSKLRYLLYEDGISSEDAPLFRGLDGVLLQSKPDGSGYSKNPGIARLQS